MAAGWKKVLVEDANVQVGTITANLANNTSDITSANSGTTFNMVTSANAGGSAGELQIRTMNLGTAAFSAASDFQASGSYLTASDMVKDLVAGTGLTGGANDVLYGTDADVTISLANIADMRVLGNVSGATAAPVAVTINDTDNMSDASASTLATSESIKAYVDSEISSNAAPTNFLTDDADDTMSGVLTANGFIAPSLTVTAATGTNTAGTALNIAAGQGTGSGAGGAITFQVADGGASGSAANTLVTALTIADDKTVTAAGNVVITGTLQVDGTTTTVNSENVLLEDHFLALNNNAGTPADADSGIVFQLASDAAAFGFDQSAGRFAFDFTGATAGQTTISSDAFPSAVVTTDDSNYQKNGNIRIDSSTIYIYTEA